MIFNPVNLDNIKFMIYDSENHNTNLNLIYDSFFMNYDYSFLFKGIFKNIYKSNQKETKLKESEEKIANSIDDLLKSPRTHEILFVNRETDFNRTIYLQDELDSTINASLYNGSNQFDPESKSASIEIYILDKKGSYEHSNKISTDTVKNDKTNLIKRINIDRTKNNNCGGKNGLIY